MMAVDERARHELYGQLERALGSQATDTLMELLPPVGWADVATTRDLDALGHRVDAQIAEVRVELADLRTDLRTEIADLAGGLRQEMAVGQRQLLFAMLGAMFTLTGLVWAVVTLAR